MLWEDTGGQPGYWFSRELDLDTEDNFKLDAPVGFEFEITLKPKIMSSKPWIKPWKPWSWGTFNVSVYAMRW